MCGFFARESGGSTINFHEFLLETIDGIYFVIYLVKWLPRSPCHSLRFVLALVIVLSAALLRLLLLLLFRLVLLLFLFLLLHFWLCQSLRCSAAVIRSSNWAGIIVIPAARTPPRVLGTSEGANMSTFATTGISLELSSGSVCTHTDVHASYTCVCVCVWGVGLCDNVGAHVRGILCGRIEFISNSYVSFSS